MTPFQFVTAVLAAYRGTRVLTTDTIFDGTRETVKLWGINQQSTPGDKLAEWVTCPWCMGVWVSFLVTCVARRQAPWRLGLDGAAVAVAVAGGQAVLVATESALTAASRAATARAKVDEATAKMLTEPAPTVR